jgi:uncharacterized membrane protein (UPF0127 family)
MILSAVAGDVPLWRLEVGDSWLARLRGLIGRSRLAPGEGLYLPGTNGVHMLFMRFAIDCLFLGAPRTDGARPIVALKPNLPPWTGIVWWVRGARGAIELPAGALAESGLRVGDYVRLAPVD